MLKNIVLIGFMATGKTLISNILKVELDCEVLSTDHLIEQQEGKSVPQIFEDDGEDYFRKVEKRIVQEVSEKQGVIVDCGGGVVINEENVSNLKKNGIVFCLTSSPDVILKRVKMMGNRPLLNVDNPMAKIEELLSKRKDYYEGAADHILDTSSGDFDKVAEDIIRITSNE